MARPSMDDYIDVAERIQDFVAKYPDGSLQTVDWGTTEVSGKSFVWYSAAAYRTPEDTRPGMGIAWEPHPGPTPYTKDSELMNAETAAWGRAIVALGLCANRKIASKQEVKARTEEPAVAASKVPKLETPKLLTPAQVKRVMEKLKDADPKEVQLYLAALGATDLPELTPAQANELVKKCA